MSWFSDAFGAINGLHGDITNAANAWMGTSPFGGSTGTDWNAYWTEQFSNPAQGATNVTTGNGAPTQNPAPNDGGTGDKGTKGMDWGWLALGAGVVALVIWGLVKLFTPKAAPRRWMNRRRTRR